MSAQKLNVYKTYSRKNVFSKRIFETSTDTLFDQLLSSSNIEPPPETPFKVCDLPSTSKPPSFSEVSSRLENLSLKDETKTKQSPRKVLKDIYLNVTANSSKSSNGSKVYQYTPNSFSFSSLESTESDESKKKKKKKKRKSERRQVKEDSETENIPASSNGVSEAPLTPCVKNVTVRRPKHNRNNLCPVLNPCVKSSAYRKCGRSRKYSSASLKNSQKNTENLSTVSNEERKLGASKALEKYGCSDSSKNKSSKFKLGLVVNSFKKTSEISEDSLRSSQAICDSTDTFSPSSNSPLSKVGSSLRTSFNHYLCNRNINKSLKSIVNSSNQSARSGKNLFNSVSSSNCNYRAGTSMSESSNLDDTNGRSTNILTDSISSNSCVDFGCSPTCSFNYLTDNSSAPSKPLSKVDVSCSSLNVLSTSLSSVSNLDDALSDIVYLFENVDISCSNLHTPSSSASALNNPRSFNSDEKSHSSKRPGIGSCVHRKQSIYAESTPIKSDDSSSSSQPEIDLSPLENYENNLSLDSTTSEINGDDFPLSTSKAEVTSSNCFKLPSAPPPKLVKKKPNFYFSICEENSTLPNFSDTKHSSVLFNFNEENLFLRCSSNSETISNLNQRCSIILESGKNWRRSFFQAKKRSEYHFRPDTLLEESSDCNDSGVENLQKDDSLATSSCENHNEEICSLENFLSQVSAKEYILSLCDQKEPLPFSERFPEQSLQDSSKIGEGVFGEVFLLGELQDNSVIKVIPIEGEELVNDEHQKTFEEVLSEVVIAKELSNLRKNPSNQTSNFNKVVQCSCVFGRYPRPLIDKWNDYEAVNGSYNDCPTMFNDEQLYIVLKLANAGKDLESFEFSSAYQSYSAFLQISLALAVAEEALEFEHRDLHWGNILLSRTSMKKVVFKLNNKEYIVPTHGVLATIIDFTLSRVKFQHEDQSYVIYFNLGCDPELFQSEGDYQFDIYRMMKAEVQDKWYQFKQRNNIFWLHYLLDKIINLCHYRCKTKRVHFNYLDKLKAIYGCIMDYSSCESFITEYLE